MKNLKRIRKDKGLFRQELATKCNLAETVISYYENNAVNPPIDKIETIANVSIGDLLSRKDIEKNTDYESIEPRIIKKIIKVQTLPIKEQKKYGIMQIQLYEIWNLKNRQNNYRK